jgi:probable HAF family extracellular repeat protein
MRQIALCTWMALALLTAASPALADPLYNVTDLGNVSGYGLNDAGQVVGATPWGYGTAAGPDPGGFLYDSYGPNAGTMYEFNNYSPIAISASSQMLGTTVVAGDLNAVNAYGNASGVLTPIVEGAAEPGASHVVTPTGQVLIPQEDMTTYQTQSYVYSPDGSRIALGTPPNQAGFTGTAINDWGQVVGFSSPSSGYQAYLYSGGMFHSLGALPGVTDTMPMAINDAGQVVGFADSPKTGLSESFLYSNGTMQVIPSLGGTVTNAYGISNTGVVYGDASTAGQGNFHAFLYANGQMIDLTNMLHSLGGAISQYDSYYIEGINDKGQILVLAQEGISSHSFLLTPDGQPLPTTPSSVDVVSTTLGPYPTPEPSTLSLFALVAAAWGARRGAGPIRRILLRG